MRSLAPPLTILSFLILLGPVSASAQLIAGDALSQLLYAYRHDPSSSTAVPPTPADPNCGLVQGTVVLQQDTTCDFTLAPGSILDLNGFTLQGIVDGGGSDATIKNGTLAYGHIYCFDCVIEDLRVINGSNFVVQPTSTIRITRCFFSGNAAAMDLFDELSGHSVITASIFENNGVGVNITTSNYNTVMHNSFIGNGTGVSVYDENPGDASFNTIASNSFAGNHIGVLFRLKNCYAQMPDKPFCEKGNQVFQNLFLANRG